MKSIKIISDEIAKLEAERDFGDITPEGLEYLSVLNLCYDMLCRTSVVGNITVQSPDELKEPGFDDDEMQVYGTTSSQLADFAYAIATQSGCVNLRGLLKEIMFGYTQASIADVVGIRRATISDYFNEKKSMTTDNYEKIVNVCLKS